jgi:hypothetical protein
MFAAPGLDLAMGLCEFLGPCLVGVVPCLKIGAKARGGCPEEGPADPGAKADSTQEDNLFNRCARSSLLNRPEPYQFI